jgi:hypothetical protein
MKAVWHDACKVLERHGNPDGVSGIPSEAWADRPLGVVPNGLFFSISSACFDT